jgi:hypothetical protein
MIPWLLDAGLPDVSMSTLFASSFFDDRYFIVYWRTDTLTLWTCAMDI